MRRNSAILTTTALVLAGGGVFAQQTVNRTMTTSSATATIQAIDSTTRTVTLRDASGDEDKYTIGPQVQRFDELKVGDKVNMKYYESVVLQVRKSGQPGPSTVDSARTAGTGGALPSGTTAVQEKMTVTVKAIDPALPSITVTTPEGRTITRKVEDKKNLEGVNVGDLIDVTYTRALLVSVERASEISPVVTCGAKAKSVDA